MMTSCIKLILELIDIGYPLILLIHIAKGFTF